MSKTPETDCIAMTLYERDEDLAISYKHLCEELEQKRDAYKKELLNFLAEATDFAEDRRDFLRFLRLADDLEERYPELCAEDGADNEDE